MNFMNNTEQKCKELNFCRLIYHENHLSSTFNVQIPPQIFILNKKQVLKARNKITKKQNIN